MNPVTHALASWCLANVPELEPRDRMLVTASGLAPDIDGLGGVIDLLTSHSADPTSYFEDYHHVLHNLAACLVMTLVVVAFARRRAWVGGLFALGFHLHLLSDLVGSRGPDGYQWPIPYLLPFHPVELAWSGQWPLTSWQNTTVTVVLMALSFRLARDRGFSFLEMVSARADAVFVETLRRRFPPPGETP